MEFKYLRAASGAYLCDYLPEEWVHWPTDKQDRFLTDNAWEPLEYWEASNIRDLIVTHAAAIEDMVNASKVS